MLNPTPFTVASSPLPCASAASIASVTLGSASLTPTALVGVLEPDKSSGRGTARPEAIRAAVGDDDDAAAVGVDSCGSGDSISVLPSSADSRPRVVAVAEEFPKLMRRQGRLGAVREPSLCGAGRVKWSTGSTCARVAYHKSGLRVYAAAAALNNASLQFCTRLFFPEPFCGTYDRSGDQTPEKLSASQRNRDFRGNSEPVARPTK